MSERQQITPQDEHLIPGKTRIRDTDGFVATVLYVGPVASAKKQEEIYVGVEWDDDTRGKHDGSIICRRTNQIVRHFISKRQSGGSFLRISKLDLGVDLDVKLMKSRYVDLTAELVAPNNVLPYVAMTSSGRDKPIELLGELEIRQKQQLEDLDDIALRSMGIARLSYANRKEMGKTFGHMKELDLAGNLLSDWGTVFDIIKLFPLLEVVSFASNRILDITLDQTLKSEDFHRIRVLNINKCSIGSFETILAIDQLCPNLETLCVAHGDLSDIEGITNSESVEINENDKDTCLSEPATKTRGFSCLKLLDLTSCNLTSWDKQVRKMSFFPKLETLILNDNPLAHVSSPIPKNVEKKSDFPELIQLQLAGTTVESWGGIENIAFFPKLRSFRFRNVPLTLNIGAGEARASTIARLPQIERLNASLITKRERTESERRYVSNASRELLLLKTQLQRHDPILEDGTGDYVEPKVNNEISKKEMHIFKKYPRFEELMVKHKDSMLTAQSSTLSGGTISHHAVNVTIRSMAAESCTREPLHKRLPGNLKVGRLKIMCARGFGLNVELQRLHFRAEGDPFPTDLDDDENTLTYYAVNDGAEILMNEIDVEAERKETLKRVELQNQRIDEQEKSSNTLQALQKNEIKAHLIATEKAADRIL